jgi:hypothetical protein
MKENNDVEVKLWQVAALFLAMIVVMIGMLGWIYNDTKKTREKEVAEQAKKEVAGYYTSDNQTADWHYVEVKVTDVATSDGRSLGLAGGGVGLLVGHPIIGIIIGNFLSTSDSYELTIECNIKGKKYTEKLDGYKAEKIVDILKYGDEKEQKGYFKAVISEVHRLLVWHQNGSVKTEDEYFDHYEYLWPEKDYWFD